MKFDIITLFPKMIDSYCRESILGRAQKNKKIKVISHDLRQWTSDIHRTVDDAPFGGGAGMILKVEPIYNALKELKALKNSRKTQCTILLSASGTPFTQAKAIEFSKYKRLIFVCGRYEGVDQRVADFMVDEEISVGPYVVTGGELPALTIIDAVARLIPGVLGNKDSLVNESFSTSDFRPLISDLRPPTSDIQYTRPSIFKPKRGVSWEVPHILLSGNHTEIDTWRKLQSHRSTHSQRS